MIEIFTIAGLVSMLGLCFIGLVLAWYFTEQKQYAGTITFVIITVCAFFYTMSTVPFSIAWRR